MSVTATVHRRRRRLESGVNLTPLLDATLNLLFFFLLVTTLRKEEYKTEIKLPSSEFATKAEGETQSISLDADGNIFFQGREMVAEELELTLMQLAKSGTERVTIRGDRETQLGRFTEIVDICRRAGIKDALMQTQKEPGGAAP